MSIKSEYSGQYLSKQDELIICEGGRTSTMILMLKGKLDVYLSSLDDISDTDESILNSSCRLFSLEQNTFFSINDIMRNGQNSFSLKAREACTLYCFPSTSFKDIKSVIFNQKDYSTYVVSSLATLIDSSYNAWQKLLPISQNLNLLAQNLQIYYWAVKDKYYFQYEPVIENFDDYKAAYENLRASDFKFFPFDPDSFPVQFDFINSSDAGKCSSDINGEIDFSSIEYFSRLLNIPLDKRKTFFNSDDFICEYHIEKASEILNILTTQIKNLLACISRNVDFLYLNPENLIWVFGKIAVDSKDDKEAAVSIVNILSKSIELLVNNVDKLKNEFDYFTFIDTPKMSAYVDEIKTKASVSSNELNSLEVLSEVNLPEELNNSLENILKYCSSSSDFISDFNKRISQFRVLKDKTSNESDVRALRSSLTADFFNIYETAFKRVQAENRCPKLISMFLNFGYMDERLLTDNQVITLYRLCDKEYDSSRYSIYTAKNWLGQIYTHQKDPSINDFGQDYYDIFRDMKKRKIVTDNDKANYYNDHNGKINFEINNMLKTNQKVCHGQMSSYFPILHKDIITRDLDKSIITPVKVQRAIDSLLAVDFSIFYREIWYKNDIKGIEKEAIMKEILPDIILVPTFGSRSSMWQEITGRNRNSPGRFILPAFTDESINNMLLKLIGAFRWELCRTMMGVAWNDITEKSLTSEYTDYIQFYKKNHDLTEDAKDKIKIQIQKNRNMMKDIFTSDYETWINYESKGILRLNRIARSILFRYCPLPKELRTNLAKQPAFSELAMQLNSSRAKTARTLTAKYSKIFKNEPMDKDMEANLIFYRDM